MQDIKRYEEKSQKATSEYKREYFKEYMRVSFRDGENFDNYETVLKEYLEALKTRSHIVDQLFDEIKIIKKLKV